MFRSRNFLLLFISLWIAVCFIFLKPTLAQNASNTGAIVGAVKDQTGAVILGASVKVRNLSTNLTRTVESKEQGLYLFSELVPGIYEITVNADGFEPKIEKVALSLGTTALVDLNLLVSGAQYEEQVIVESTLVNKNKTESSTNIDNRVITSLPINQRNFLEFALITARVTRDALPSQGSITTSGLSINGQSARNNNLTIDGVNNNSFAGGGTLSIFSQEAVQEFQVVTDSFSAEVGRSTAGTINIITKSGGNDLHGNLFFFSRNNDLSARNAFTTINPEFRQYQFGSTLGGALKKDKIFFFGAFERLSVKQNNIVTISDQTIASLNSQGFFQKNGPIPFSVSATTALAKLDWVVSAKDTINIRYNGGFSYDGAIERFGALIGDTNGSQQRVKDNAITFSNNYFSSNFVNETRFVFSRRNRSAFPIGNQPNVVITAPEGMVISGQNIILPQFTRERTFQIINNTSLSYKKHIVKFGIDNIFTGTLPGSFGEQFSGGVYNFSPINFTALTGIPNLPTFTGLEAFDPSLRSPAQKTFLAFLSTNPGNIFPGFPKNLALANLPLPSLFLQGFGDNTSKVSGNFFAAFIQDEFKPKSNLTLKAGLRYDITRVSFIPNNNGNFSPRLAFSYQPKRFSNLSFTGAYGLFFGRPIGAYSGFVESYATGLKVLVLPPPFSTIPLILADKRFPKSTQLPQGVNFVPQLSLTVQADKEFRNTYSQQANLKMNLFSLSNTIISAEYTFVRGLKLVASRDINPIVRPVTNDPIGSFIKGRIDPSKGSVFELESAYDSSYNALTLAVTRSIRNKLTLLASYTYSKAIDNTSDFNPTIAETNNSLKIGDERGLSLQDIRNRFVFSQVLDTDFLTHRLLKNFQITSIITLESGKPYNLLAGVDLDSSGDLPPRDRPLGIGRNTGILPSFANVDLRLSRKIKFKENFSIQTNLEVFNLFNKVNISEIDRTFPPDAQGNFNLPKQDNGRYVAPRERFRGAFAPRQLQLGLKVSF